MRNFQTVTLWLDVISRHFSDIINIPIIQQGNAPAHTAFVSMELLSRNNVTMLDRLTLVYDLSSIGHLLDVVSHRIHSSKITVVTRVVKDQMVISSTQEHCIV